MSSPEKSKNKPEKKMISPPVKVISLYEESETTSEYENEWMLFRRDMFGTDFEISEDIIIKNKEINACIKDRDQTMKVLQEKSFRGLYLRLQFWIN
jgi:hypothetical protein